MTDQPPRKPPHPDQAERGNTDEADAACAPFTVIDLVRAFHKPHHRSGDGAIAVVVPVPVKAHGLPYVTTGFSAIGDHTDPDEADAVGFAMCIGHVMSVAWMPTDTARNLIALIQHAIDSYEAGRLIDEIGGTPGLATKENPDD